MILIQPEMPADYAAVCEIHRRAFGRANEAELVESLRRVAQPQISLVVVSAQQLVGHIFFSAVSIQGASSAITALGLGPMAVAPEVQNRGLGSRLVRAGLEACRLMGHQVVVVLGHPHFYPRFGFEPASRKGLRYEHPVPDEVFMVTELKPGALSGHSGVVHYLPEFSQV